MEEKIIVSGANFRRGITIVWNYNYKSQMQNSAGTRRNSRRVMVEPDVASFVSDATQTTDETTGPTGYRLRSKPSDLECRKRRGNRLNSFMLLSIVNSKHEQERSIVLDTRAKKGYDCKGWGMSVRAGDNLRPINLATTMTRSNGRTCDVTKMRQSLVRKDRHSKIKNKKRRNDEEREEIFGSWNKKATHIYL